MSLPKKITLGLMVILIAIQFVRPDKNLQEILSPNHISNVVNVPVNVELILKTSCYDCHSNNTKYLWYSEIMPLGWWINHHIEEGKAGLNFSDFGLYSKKKQSHKLEETKEEVMEHEMPLESYTLYHKEAKLSESQVKIISDWVESARVDIIKTSKK